MHDNPELELAEAYVTRTDRNLFLTGNAGTGKTTFLHRIRERCGKRKVVVAPTGVAAINARGTTIHSQFQLPFGVLTPDRLQGELRKHRISRKKVEVIRSLDLLIIDEISMVRADVLDGISSVLGKYRGNSKPFGGVQLLMIGDLHQLPPVVRDTDRVELMSVYPSPYFFDSLALKRAGAKTIKLKRIYRQSDQTFIELLNRVRHDEMDPATLTQLNARHRSPVASDPGAEAITLTSHNRTADRINRQRLNELEGRLYTFTAAVEGNFPPSMYPNDEKLEFRVGAQVMFNRNDTAEQAYFNGKIGRISAIDGEDIAVTCEDGGTIYVRPVVWENRVYELNKQTKEVTDEVVGTYEQHPLRLAWAITIHKSQGLTFDRVVIDAEHAFAHGQVYVALSRCRSLEGIVLSSRIQASGIRTDRAVKQYDGEAERGTPTRDELRRDCLAYEIRCLRELFDFRPTEVALTGLDRAFLEDERSIQGEGHHTVAEARERFAALAEIADRFRGQIPRYGKRSALPSEQTDLQSRLQKAGAFMVPKLQELLAGMSGLEFMSDNRAVYTKVAERTERVCTKLAELIAGFESLKDGFSTERYLRARSDVAIAGLAKGERSRSRDTAPVSVTYPKLYADLAAWRRALAEEGGKPAYRILPNKVLLAIVESLPRSAAELLALKGFGNASLDRYGDRILEIVARYLDSHPEALANRTEPATAAEPKPSTFERTRRLFEEGLDVATIAERRGMHEGTINSHLARYVELGEIEAGDLLAAEDLETIKQYFARSGDDRSLRSAYDHFSGAFGYDALRIGKAASDYEASAAARVGAKKRGNKLPPNNPKKPNEN